MSVVIKPWCAHTDQTAKLGKHHWSVARLVELSRHLPVMELPLLGMNIYHRWDGMNLRDFIMHMRAVQAADLSYPIILDEDGEIMDGRHRLMRAILDGCENIKAVRFETNPEPCKIDP